LIERAMSEWMEDHEYDSVEQLKGSMSQQHCPEPAAFERAQYMRALATYPARDGRASTAPA
jgi:dihydroorotate dehydrogenase (fumarate)